MPVLTNVKQERFAQAIAKGLNASEAARRAGYSKDRASAQGCTLRKHPKIAARIIELSNRIEEHIAQNIAVSKDWVIQGLIRNIDDARQAEQFGVVRQCFVDIGKELGMFVERIDAKFQWDGDTSKLDAGQLAKLILSLEQLIPPEERELTKKEALALPEPTGMVIEATAETPAEVPASTPLDEG